MMSKMNQLVKKSSNNGSRIKLKQQAVVMKPSFVPIGRDSHKVLFNGGSGQQFAIFKPLLDATLGSSGYLTYVNARGPIDPATGMETFISPRLADLDVTLPIVADRIQDLRNAQIARINHARDDLIAATNADLALNAATRNDRIRDANYNAAIRVADVDYNDFDNYRQQAEREREARAKEIKEVQDRHGKICECIRQILGPLPRHNLAGVFATGCGVCVYEALHLNYMDNSRGDTAQTVLTYLTTCSFRPQDEPLDYFLAKFESNLQVFVNSGNVITEDVRRRYMSDALARGSDMFAEDIRDAQRRHPDPPTVAQFKEMIWRTYGEYQNLEVSIGYLNRDEFTDFGGNTSSDGTRVCWKCGSTKHISTSKDCPKNKQQSDKKGSDKKQTSSTTKPVYAQCPHCKKTNVKHTAKNCYMNKNGPNYRSDMAAQSSLGKRKASYSSNDGGRVPAPGTYHRYNETAASTTSNKKQKKIIAYNDEEESVNCVYDVMVDIGEISYFTDKTMTSDIYNSPSQYIDGVDMASKAVTSLYTLNSSLHSYGECSSLLQSSGLSLYELSLLKDDDYKIDSNSTELAKTLVSFDKELCDERDETDHLCGRTEICKSCEVCKVFGTLCVTVGSGQSESMTLSDDHDMHIVESKRDCREIVEFIAIDVLRTVHETGQSGNDYLEKMSQNIAFDSDGNRMREKIDTMACMMDCEDCDDTLQSTMSKSTTPYEDISLCDNATRDSSFLQHDPYEQTSNVSSNASTHRAMLGCMRYLIDSGASRHMSPWQDDFLYIDRDRVNGSVIFANGSRARIEGIGTLENGLEDVLYVPNSLKVGLISVSMIDDAGGQCTFGKGKAIVKNADDVVIITGSKHDRLYVMDNFVDVETAIKGTAFTTRVRSAAEYMIHGIGRNKLSQSRWSRQLNEVELMHKCGHMSLFPLLKGIEHGTLIGHGISKYTSANVKNFRPCIACLKGKLDPLPVYRANKTDKLSTSHVAAIKQENNGDIIGPFHRLYVDPKGTFSKRAIDGSHSVHVITTRPSHMIFVPTMKSKNEVYQTLDQVLTYCDQVISKQAHLRNTINFATLNSDDESIYLTQSFAELCAKWKIEHKTSAPYKKEMNGVIERDIKTLFNLANVYMIEMAVPLMFWKQALEYAALVLNSTPRQDLDWKTPLGYIYNRPTDVSLFQMFYAPGLMILSSDERDKRLGSPKAVECRYLGVIDNAYLVWVPSKNKIFRRRDCLFEHHLLDRFPNDQELDEFLAEYPQLYKDAHDDEPTMIDKPDFFEDTIDYQDQIDQSSSSESAEMDVAQQEQQFHNLQQVSQGPSIEQVVGKDGDHDQISNPPDPYKSILFDDSSDQSSDISSIYSNVVFNRGKSSLTSIVTKFLTDAAIIAAHHRFGSESKPYPMFKVHHHRVQIPRLRMLVETANKADINSLSLGEVPATMEEAMNGPNKLDWIRAYEKEWDGLYNDREVFKYCTEEELAQVQRNIKASKKPISMKIVLKLKIGAEGQTIYKIRLVARGFEQRYLVDYKETYSPTLGRSIMRAVLFLCMSVLRFQIELADFDQAFAQASLNDPIFAELPRFMRNDPNVPLYVVMSKALYGLKQASLMWYDKFRNVIEDIGFMRLAVDACVFCLHVNGELISILTIYVDDMMVFAKDKKSINRVMKLITTHLPEVTRFADFNKYLGMDILIDSNNHTVEFNQKRYIENAMGPDKFNIDTSHVRRLPTIPMDDKIKYIAQGTGVPDKDEVNYLQQMHGTLRHIADNTCPDISSTLGILSHSLTKPVDFEEMKSHHEQVFKYLKLKSDRKVIIGGHQVLDVFAFSDASHMKEHDSKGRLGVVIYFGHKCGAILAKSQKETTISHSSMESEITAIDMAIRYVNVFRDLLAELGFEQTKPTIIYVDTLSGIELANSFKMNDKSRHINAKLNFIRQEINLRHIELVFIPTHLNVADILTKNLSSQLHEMFAEWLARGIPDEVYERIRAGGFAKMHNQFGHVVGFIYDEY